MSILLSSDSFNRANGPLGSTDGSGTKDPAAWTTAVGTFAIASNVATVSALAHPVWSGIFLMASASVDLGTGNVDLSITLPNASGHTGLLFRFQDASNFWMFYANAPSNYTVQEVKAGLLLGGTSAALTPNNNDVLRLLANGSSITAFVNGVQQISVTNSDFQAATKHGLYVDTFTTGTWDNWSASDPTVVPYGGQYIGGPLQLTFQG